MRAIGTIIDVRAWWCVPVQCASRSGLRRALVCTWMRAVQDLVCSSLNKGSGEGEAAPCDGGFPARFTFGAWPIEGHLDSGGPFEPATAAARC